jgi:hypothetical protein
MSEVAKLPRWKCHKVVSAARIKRMFTAGADGTGTLVLQLSQDGAAVETHTSVEKPAEWMERFKPEAGGYYVVYEDGYESFSPAKAFEDGYARLEG